MQIGVSLGSALSGWLTSSGVQVQVPSRHSLKPQPPAQVPWQMMVQVPPPVPRQYVRSSRQLLLLQQPPGQVEALQGWQAPFAHPFAQDEVLEP